MEVTSAGYELLENTGLGKRIDDRWNELSKLVPLTAVMYEGDVDEILEKDIPDERRRKIQNWAKGRDEFDMHPDEFFTISGEVTDALLTRKEQKEYVKSGIISLSELDGLLASYCMTKYFDHPLREAYVWRSEDFKTRIFGDTHGDLQMRQIELKPKSKSTLFGVKPELFGELPSRFINADYSYWPITVATSLKFADTVGIKIPEVEDWRGFLKEEYGWSGTIKRAYHGIGYDNLVYDYNSDILAELPDKTNIMDVKKRFFGFMRPNADTERFYLPVIDEDKNLVFFSNSGGSTKLAPLGEPTNCQPEVVIKKDEASHLFKGTVHGIMTSQSRTNPSILGYVLWEYDQIKAGKKMEEIRREGRNFSSF